MVAVLPGTRTDRIAKPEAAAEAEVEAEVEAEAGVPLFVRHLRGIPLTYEAAGAHPHRTRGGRPQRHAYPLGGVRVTVVPAATFTFRCSHPDVVTFRPGILPRQQAGRCAARASRMSQPPKRWARSTKCGSTAPSSSR